MTNNSDGLSPTLRAQLGKGFGRALPPAFRFDNMIQPDGINDHFVIPGIAGKTLPVEMCVEFWRKGLSAASDYVLALMQSASGANRGVVVGSGGLGSIGFTGNAEGGYPNTINLNFPADGVWGHFVMNTSRANPYPLPPFVSLMNGGELYGGMSKVGGNQAATTFGPDGNYGTPTVVDISYLFRSSYEPGSVLNSYGGGTFAEVRIYKRNITQNEAVLLYNNGTGNSPLETENLLLWYKFNQFEMLDFSPLQNGTDMRLGIRDFSGNNYHAQPVNMDTNPASPNYVIKPFA
jgi:hypothetical protein